jgi:hypothetical protein
MVLCGCATGGIFRGSELMTAAGRSALLTAAQMLKCGAGGVIGPGLGCSPDSRGSEIDAEGTGGAIGGKDFREAVAELGQGGAEGMETGDGGHAGEVQGVTGCVEVAFEDCGVFAA